MSTADRILDLIDAGLQETTDPGFGQESYDNGFCARCQWRHRPEGSDWCDPCRAYLLGDAGEPPPLAPNKQCPYLVCTSCPGVRAADLQLVDVFAEVALQLVETFAGVVDAALQWLARLAERTFRPELPAPNEWVRQHAPRALDVELVAGPPQLTAVEREPRMSDPRLMTVITGQLPALGVTSAAPRRCPRHGELGPGGLCRRCS